MKKPGKRQLRGLHWVTSQARANFESCQDEPASTGQFSGTTPNEVADALAWLDDILRDAASKDGRDRG